MTNLTESAMLDADEKAGNNSRRNFWMMSCVLSVIMLLGAIIGMLSDDLTEGTSAIGPSRLVVLAVLGTIICVLGFAIWRLAQQIKQNAEKVPRREQLNNRILIGCGLFGGIIGLTLALTDNFGAAQPNLFSSNPMSPPLAAILSVCLGIIMPAVTLYWHKHVVDEQEEAAYRAGALIAIYAFWFIAPVWWLLWRGGILPAPDGVALYLMTTFVALIVWFWKKYR